VRDASALELEIKTAQGQPPNPDAQQDEEMKLIAIDALMQSDEERAIPMLEKILSGNSLAEIERAGTVRALAERVVKAKDVLGADRARTAAPRSWQKKALHYLGIDGSNTSRQVLQDIYNSSQDPAMRKEVLHSFMVSGDTDRVFAIAQKEQSVEMKKEAIHELGVMGATNPASAAL